MVKSWGWEFVRVNDIVSKSLSDRTIQWLADLTARFGVIKVVQIALHSALLLVLLILSLPLFFLGLLVADIGGRNL